MKLKDLYKLVIWDILNPFLLNLRKHNKYKFDSSFTGINLGSGIDNPPNWLDVDGGATHFFVKKLPKFITSKFFKYFNMANNYSFEEYYEKLNSFKSIHFNLCNGIPFESEAIPNIFSSHFFEHLFKNDCDCEFLLKECYRVLKSGGLIRICVPSLDDEVIAIKEAIDEYENGTINKIQKYVTSDIVGYNSKFSNHRFMYDYKELHNLLQKIGFIEIERKYFKKGNIPDVELLDTRNGIFVEAKKPYHFINQRNNG